MLFSPIYRIINFDFIYFHGLSSIGGNREPFETFGGFYLVAVSPISGSILGSIQEYKVICLLNDMEVSFPGNII